MKKELSLRIGSAIIYVAIIFLGFGLHPLVAQLLLLIIFSLAIGELFQLLKKSGSLTEKIITTSIYSLAYGYWLYYAYQYISFIELFESKSLILTTVLSCAALLTWSIYILTSSGNYKNHHIYIGLFIHILMPFYYGSILMFYPSAFNPHLILGIFVLIWVNDTSAYFIGKNFGKTKLAPSISPNKTIEGFLGGAIVTIIIAIGLSFLLSYKTPGFWFLFSLIISLTSPAGDLIESKLKRLAQAKDSGSIMPGHGGILDRLDGFIYSLPFLFLFVILFD